MRLRNRLPMLATMVTAVTLLSACGSSGGSGGSSSSANAPGQAGGQPAGGKVPEQPCSLVSKAEVEAVVGLPFDEPVATAATHTCTYNPTGPVAGQTKIAFIAGAAVYESIKGSQPTLGGVGDAAVCDPAYGNLSAVSKAKDLTFAVVSVDCDKAKAIALKVLAKL